MADAVVKGRASALTVRPEHLSKARLDDSNSGKQARSAAGAFSAGLLETHCVGHSLCFRHRSLT